MEALTCQLKFYGVDTDMLTAFGFVSGSRPLYGLSGLSGERHRAGHHRGDRGFVQTVTPDARGKDSLSENAVTWTSP
jgi:hypothetical protein